MTDARLQAYLEQDEGDVLVTADPGLVRMLTGHVGEVDSGPSPFALPALVVAPGDGEPVLVCSEDEAPDGVRAETYEGFTVDRLDTAARAAQALRRAAASSGVDRRRVLVDVATVPAVAWAELARPRAAGAPLLLLGARKRPDEIEGIARAVAVCDTGQRAARAATAECASELDVWTAARAAMERAAGGRIPVIADLVSGARTAEVGGPPTPRRLAGDELVLCDLVPRVDGLWGDSCATWSVDGPPSPPAVRLYDVAREALAFALDRLRPGTVAGELDAAVRGRLAEAGVECPHHIGHGLGFRWHEEPRIVPEGTTVLEEDMIVALEPGGYSAEDGAGVRVEVVAVVTSDGARVLSGHDLALE